MWSGAGSITCFSPIGGGFSRNGQVSMCSREMTGNKRGNRGFDNRRSRPTKISVGVGLGRDSEITPTGVGFHGISMGFTIAFLNQSVDRSLFSRLIAIHSLDPHKYDLIWRDLVSAGSWIWAPCCFAER